MSKNKKNSLIQLPGLKGNDFADDEALLNYRPNISYVEPLADEFNPEIKEEVPTINVFRDKTKALVESFNKVVKLADITQERIDNRIKSGGGISIKLDPLVDQHVIAAIERRYPDKEDKTVINYEDYKRCIQNMNNATPPVPQVETLGEVDSYQTDFGGYKNILGQNRPELNSAIIKPINSKAFQASGIIALFGLLLPLLNLFGVQLIGQHIATSKHIIP